MYCLDNIAVTSQRSLSPVEYNNKPHYTLFLGLNISCCQGCSSNITKELYPPPKNLTFHMQAHRVFWGPSTGEWRHNYGNIYFHLNWDCVRMKYRNMKKDAMNRYN